MECTVRAIATLTLLALFSLVYSGTSGAITEPETTWDLAFRNGSVHYDEGTNITVVTNVD